MEMQMGLCNEDICGWKLYRELDAMFHRLKGDARVAAWLQHWTFFFQTAFPGAATLMLTGVRSYTLARATSLPS